jgi:hypothetical protein
VWVGTALFVRVLSVFAVHVTGLEILVLALGGTLLVVSLVVVASTTITKIGVLALTIALRMIAVAASRVPPVAPALALVGKMAQLARVSLLQLMSQLVLCLCTNLFDLMAL